MKQWKRDCYLGIVILIFSIISLVYSYGLTDHSVKYFLAKADTYVMLWLIILGILAVMLIVRSLKNKPDDIKEPILTKRTLVTAGIIVGYVFLMNKLGFIISSLLFVFLLLFYFTKEEMGELPKGKELRRMIILWIIITALTVALVQYLFGNLLALRLPEGIFN